MIDRRIDWQEGMLKYQLIYICPSLESSLGTEQLIDSRNDIFVNSSPIIWSSMINDLRSNVPDRLLLNFNIEIYLSFNDSGYIDTLGFNKYLVLGLCKKYKIKYMDLHIIDKIRDETKYPDIFIKKVVREYLKDK